MKILLLVLSIIILPNFYTQVNLDWAKDYKYSAVSDDSPTVMKLDRNGSIYVLGNSYLENSGYFSLVKYNSSGNLIWSKNYGVPFTEGLVSATSMVIDTGGSIYISGEYNTRNKVFIRMDCGFNSYLHSKDNILHGFHFFSYFKHH